jgi:hypothetical protein
MEPARQPTASSGLRIDHKTNDGLLLADILDVIDVGPGDARWELTAVSVVWWEGQESPWDDSWNDTHPLVLADPDFRQQAVEIIQVVNGRFSAYDRGREIVVVEAIDSSFWLVWSDDAEILDKVRERFPAAYAASPPSTFQPHG